MTASSRTTGSGSPKQKSAPAKRDWASGNEAKYYGYKEAWARIRLARKQGFYLEAVTIQESILSDRMLSYLAKVAGVELPDATKRNLSRVQAAWFKAACAGCATADHQELAALHQEVDLWRRLRNTVVHGIVKSKVGPRDDHITDFLQKAHDAAAVGEVLARAVDRWCARQQKRVKESGVAMIAPDIDRGSPS